MIFLKGTIKENREFVYAYRRGKKVVSRAMVLHYYRNRTGVTRLGITATKAVGGAVQRNRAKRLIRECWRQAAPGIKPGYNVIIAARSALSSASLQEARRNLQYCLQKTELTAP